MLRTLASDYSVGRLNEACSLIRARSEDPMKRQSRRPKSPLEWLKHLDAGAIEAAREEALLDAYGDDEQRAALASMAASELVCPFQASVIGRHVTVVDVSESEFG